MCVLAGEDAEDRGWVYFTEARQFPVKDLLTIDALWTFYSDGRFGFSVQRKIWVGQRRQWAKFFKQIDWVQGENNAYRKWPEGSSGRRRRRAGIALTNAPRGTQLLEALLEHPAAAKPKDAATQVSDAMEGAKKGLEGALGSRSQKPDWMSKRSERLWRMKGRSALRATRGREEETGDPRAGLIARRRRASECAPGGRLRCTTHW